MESPQSIPQQQNQYSYFQVSADLLVWYPSEEPSNIWVDKVDLGYPEAYWAAKSYKLEWSYGFRFGLGYDFGVDSFDTFLCYTWYHSHSSRRVHADGADLSPEFFAAFLNGDEYNIQASSIFCKWGLFFNMFDWEIGKKLEVTKELILRPYTGLKGGWINQPIYARYDDLILQGVVTPHKGFELLRNNFWGVGPMGGLDLDWIFAHTGSSFFKLITDFSFAGLYGSFRNIDKYGNSLDQQYRVYTKNASLGAWMVKGLLGFGYDLNLYQDKMKFHLNLGYEMQIWFNQLRIATFQLQRLHGDLTLQGITLNCMLEF